MRRLQQRMNLQSLLQSTFGFPAFRANQEAVCRAATGGRDVLLVMPTGAGKSLCYQLPAIARGGTALVISPLIALMDDQALKLDALGLRVARIHSGLSREHARQACRDYLDGTLHFLFIAPERMRVPGFPEMLAKRKPALIAIDEAHCISAWGHDFRPDYRTLGDYLPTLRPAPIIALTATATPTVQKDIVAQLNLADPALFIHGFRRENLAIEVVEMSKPRRPEFTATLLADPANRPAIVYAPSRKAAEELAAILGKGSAPYHAGLDAGTRERVQRHFLSGQLQVVVATIAFGMGIDKADVRTVIHTALPGSVEAFYQEIGRAGRDGLPSRTILLHSYADRKMHDFFLERDYPPPTELARVAGVLTAEYQMPDLLRQRLRMDAESFDNAAGKLVSQGAAVIDIEGNVRGTGSTTWRGGYDAQVAFRRGQIDRMAAFAEAQQCRMTSLIRHFGDTADGTRPCGRCDICNPSTTAAQSFREPDDEDLRQLSAILRALDGRSRSTGQLHTELAAVALRGTAAGKDRKVFDDLLNSLVRAGLVALTAGQWTNPEGNLVSFKKASLTHEGNEAAATGSLPVDDLQIRNAEGAPAGAGKTPRKAKSGRQAAREETNATLSPAQAELEARLRAWRKAEAAKTGKPAFIVFGDRVLTGIARAMPATIPQLLQVSGIGPEKAKRYGAAVCALCCNEAPDIGETSISPQRKPRPVATSTESEPARAAPVAIAPVQAARGASALLTKGVARTPPRSYAGSAPASARPAETAFTPDQQQLESRLREWRRLESERLGLPQFFVLGSVALRAIVLSRPRTLDHLQTVSGLGPEKTARFGPAILAHCGS